jgi:hypothetical protein
LIPDNRLGADYTDLLDHEAIAKAVAEIALKAEAPVNIALFGPWGSGKSSIYSMITSHLEAAAGAKVRVARYDAWKYGGQELKRNFIDSLSDSLGLTDTDFVDGLHQDQTKTKLSISAWARENWRSLLAGIGLAAVVAALWILVQAGATKLFTDRGFNATAEALIPQAGTVFGLALVAVLVGPKAFEGAVTTKITPAPVGADQFASRFRKLVDKALKGKPDRLVVFIDELDRCSPDDVVATLVDLKTFLDEDRCAFVVAADREVLERALLNVPQAKPVRELEPYYATPGAFLDKIFQHQIALPPLRPRALTQFARELASTQGGVWEDLRTAGNQTYDRTIFALVPVHVRSPRRVKILLNNYATTVRIAQARGIAWLERAEELAVLTVLQTEFPAVAEEMRRVPRLLWYLRGEEKPTAPRTIEAVRRFEVIDDEDEGDDGESPAGELLRDESANAADKAEHAEDTLRHQLASYLAKIAAVNIDDPRPDLMYLQGAAGREQLSDPHLGDVIDYATDTAPDEILAAFSAADSATLAVGIPLLVVEGEGAVGPGQAFAYEAACRLIERVDAEHQEVVAREAGAPLIAAAKAGSLTQQSLPGALMVACWLEAGEVAKQLLGKLRENRLDEDVLDRLARLLPHVDETTAQAVMQLLVEHFKAVPQPLLTALHHVSVDDAYGLWNSVKAKVLEVLNDLEMPEPDPAPAAATAAAGTAPAAADAVPTGLGVERVNALIEAVGPRADGEWMVSAVVEELQSTAACEALRTWAVGNADRLIGTMESADLRAWHALAGIRDYPTSAWTTWAGLLPDEAPDRTSETAALAAEMLVEKLLPALATVADDDLRSRLPDVIAKVRALATVDKEVLSTAVRDALSAVQWKTDDEAERVLRWPRKEVLFDTTVRLSSLGSDDQLISMLVDDLRKALKSIALSEDTITKWLGLSEKLPVDVISSLSSVLDEYTLSDDEETAVLRLKLAVRGRFGGAAPPVAEVQAVPADELTTKIADSWLRLAPPVGEVGELLAAGRFTPAAMTSYAAALTTAERSGLWIQGADAGKSDGILKAIGAHGVDASVIEHARSAISSATREPDRAAHIQRLVDTAQPSSELKKVASELATDLLARDTAGDLKSAVKLIIWAGGPAHGHVIILRAEFTAAVEKHHKVLSNKQRESLIDLGLLPQKKNWFEKVFGG